MLISFHVALNKLDLFELKVKFTVKQILKKGNSVNNWLCFLNFSVDEELMLSNEVRTNLQ